MKREKSGDRKVRTKRTMTGTYNKTELKNLRRTKLFKNTPLKELKTEQLWNKQWNIKYNVDKNSLYSRIWAKITNKIGLETKFNNGIQSNIVMEMLDTKIYQEIKHRIMI